jgi:phosphatidylglycerol---prolipoprotein diacylglyceryl transferase
MLQIMPTRAIALRVGPISLYWYGILYAVAFVTCVRLAKSLQKYSTLTLTKSQWSTLFTFVCVGVLAGGRIGYIVLYEPMQFIANPIMAVKVWQGGMSFHGGLIGVGILLYVFCRQHSVSFLRLLDVLSAPIAIGLVFGRIGNFINLELYGPITTLPWGISIPGVEGLRHPTPLYAVIKDLILALLCYTALKKTGTSTPGLASALLLIGYAVLRFCIEFVRVPTHSTFTVLGIELTRGQLYSIPLACIGIAIVCYRQKRV